VKKPPSQAASLAATQAFLANRASNGDLSAAAAAAALRSHTTSPVPVGQVRTKRMQRRGSITSNGTALDRPGLLRRTSSGSMTERTFRDPSPNRPASSHGPNPRNEDAPPVPALPKNIQQALSQMPARQTATQRAASVEPMERVSSPPPRLVGGRGVSLDRGPGHNKPSEGGLKARVTSLSSVGELERPGNRNSVNFSRPMSPQNSPPTSPPVGGRVWSPPPSKSTGVAGLPNGEVERILESIQETGATPIKRKKKVAAKGPAEGSLFAQGTTIDVAQAAALLATPQRQPPPVSSTPSPSTVTMPSGINELPKPKKKKKKIVPAAGPQVHDAGDGFGNAYPSDTESVTSDRSNTNDRPRSYNTRAAGLLMKQPSVVREDREAEEQEERRPSVKTMNGQVSQNGNTGVAAPTNVSQMVSKSPQHGRAASQTDASRTPKRSSLDVPDASRHQSLSPARSTHFSSQPEYETPDGIKHQPPARSVSPAKSALKHSPSRGHSPLGSLPVARRAAFAASEASDSASNISDDGSRYASKSKKSARVSFDDHSGAIGRAGSPPIIPDSPLMMSPQKKPRGRSWLDLVREQKQKRSIVDSDQDSVIKPTPALPSFGSIRRDHNEEVAHGDVPVSTPSVGWAQDRLRSINTSSDQVVGVIISQDAASKAKEPDIRPALQGGSSDPVPPEVTSVEGSGYQSDDEANLFDNQKGIEPSSLKAEASQRTFASISTSEAASTELSSESIASEERNVPVPSIALQPATPGLEIAGGVQQEWLGMPDHFPKSTRPPHKVQSHFAPSVEHYSTEITPATVGLAEPEPEALAAQHDPGSPHVGGVADGLRTQIDSHSGDESEDTGDSIYSDAAEVPDDLDGDGFGSINAIVESPALSPIPTSAISPPASPIVKASLAVTNKFSPLARKESELSEPASDEGWDRAQAYWSGLSQEKRRQLEHAAVPGALDETVIPNKTLRGTNSDKEKKKKIPRKFPSPSGSNDPVLRPWPDKQYSNDTAKPVLALGAPLKSSLRKTQIENTGVPHMRSSMRDGPLPKSALNGGSQGASLQPSEPRGALKKNRPMSAMAMVDPNKSHPPSAPTHIRASSAGVPQGSLAPILAQPKKKAPAKKPTLRRNDSDSSSSFKKQRSSAPSSGKYTMKRTMRPSSVDARGPTNRASSMSARTASPAGSAARRPFNSSGPGGGTMRRSMRDPIDFSKPATRTSLRGSSMDSNRPKSPARFGFGKSPKPSPVDPKPNSRFSSRFGDSSDEDHRRPAKSSRFADSSDEDSANLAPVRGIPRRIDEGDSTDLDDSSVENAPTPSKLKTNGTKLTLDTKSEGQTLATGSLRVASGDRPTMAIGSGLQAQKAVEKDKKKRSFFGGLGSKKRDDPPRIQKVDTKSLARRDNPLECSKPEKTLTTGAPKSERVLGPNSPTADPVAQTGRPAIGPRISSAQNSPKSPKLQRRNTPKTVPRANDNSWPLPQSPGVATSTRDSRPRTSDGAAAANGAGRPDIGMRRTTLQGAPPPPAAPLAMGNTEKKKRFGMLRKAFGIPS